MNLFTLLQVASEPERHRWVKPLAHADAMVPNDIAWYYIAGAILVGAALLSYGVATTAIRWEADAGFPKWFSVAGGFLGILLATAAGALAGLIVWQWALGMLCGLVGAFASPWILKLVWSRFGSGDPPPPAPPLVP